MNQGDRLDSWKEIANYVKREIKTCLKWEKEFGLPVYRINTKSLRSRVFAYKTEIDQWFKKRAKMNSKAEM
ncbi:MAG: hypothetical protein ACFFDI_13625 [Promethearchaeota archaeon]